MVVSLRPRVGQLLDAIADSRRLAEIERRAGDVRDLAGGNEFIIGRRVLVGMDRQDVVQHGVTAMAGQIEIAVVGQVDRRRPVGRCLVANGEPVLIAEQIPHGDGQVAGIPFLPVRTGVGEPDGLTLPRPQNLRLPDHFVQAPFDAGMQMMVAVILGQFVRLAA